VWVGGEESSPNDTKLNNFFILRDFIAYIYKTFYEMRGVVIFVSGCGTVCCVDKK
jgi:hypothetical protein